jgi:5-methylcytosine-specific restriction endonuclease McrA
MAEVLVLNMNFEFLQIVNVRKAIKLIVKQKAEIIEGIEGKFFKAIGQQFPLPSVIRLLVRVNFEKKPVAFTRRRVFVRDKLTCQYCGDKGSKLTIDHVHPQSKGGKSTWDNCVTACIPCNKRKADKLYEDCGMKLKAMPKQPSFYQFLRSSSVVADNKSFHRWSAYLYIN